MTKDEFLLAATNKHGDNFDYADCNFTHMHKNVRFICKVHGAVQQIAKNHLRSKTGCPKCSGKKKSLTDIILEFRAKHGDKFDYSKVNYLGKNIEVSIQCKEHGLFSMTPAKHLSSKTGCTKCSGKSLSSNDILAKCHANFANKFTYHTNPSSIYDELSITCNEHQHSFNSSASKHLTSKFGCCSKCLSDDRIRKQTLDDSSVIERFNMVHDFTYSYDNVRYRGLQENVTITCKEHGEFEQRPDNHLAGKGCSKCSSLMSKGQQQLVEYLQTISSGSKIECNNRQLIKPLELDIVVPEYRVAIEYNGLYWHSELSKAKNYHLDKTIAADNVDVKLIHIFEDEWLAKRDIVKSRLSSIFNKLEHKYFARKCVVAKVSKNVANAFLEANHIQGYTHSDYCYGLFFQQELVAVMTFCRLRKALGSKNIDNTYELLRFANKCHTSVVGGASKMLKFFITEVKPIKIVSYADKRWSTGKLYRRLGFKYLHDSKPNYYYVFGQTRKHRYSYRKNLLVEQGYDKSMTEHQIMLHRGIPRIYDCGASKWSLDIV
jgi:hypothetical protein